VSPESERALLRVHLSNFAKWHTAPLYEALVMEARRNRLAGATVLAGHAGFVGDGPLLGLHPHGLRVERPIVVEMVDQEASLRRFVGLVEPMLRGHAVLLTLERAHVLGGEREGARDPRT
jgi:PII-like signaling protein